MKKKLFVSNLDFDVTEEQIQELFATIGDVASVSLATDRESKRSKGFAFVEMKAEEDAEKAIEQLTNKDLGGRPIRVCEDRGKGGGPSRSTDQDGGQKKREYLPPIQRMTLFRRRKKQDPFLSNPNKKIDFRDVHTLSRFMSDRGKILSRRMTGLNAYNQRKVKKAIKRAQNTGLLPFTGAQN